MDLITPQKAASIKCVTCAAIYAAIDDGKLTRHFEYGRVLVDTAELDNYEPRGGGTANRPRKQADSAKEAAE